MATASIRHLAVFVALGVALAGCEPGSNPFAGKDNSVAEPDTGDSAKSVRLVDRDIEAPEVFQTTDTALWDGRPSLGGIWVASPDAVNPERVILRNDANGKFVIGALFRRERDNPGPKLQISSDAAAALGMLAGQPGKISVTALRREDSEIKAAAASLPEVTAEGDVEAPPSAAKTDGVADPIVAASAALDKADGLTNPSSEDLVATVSDDLDPTPRPGETKRAARKRARAAAKAAAIATAAAPAIDGVAPLAAPVPELEVAKLPDPDVNAAPTSSGGAARVQIGIYSVEANAKLAADKLIAGGVNAVVRKEEIKGKSSWSVVANGDGGSKALLAKVKSLGFADAYVVAG